MSTKDANDSRLVSVVIPTYNRAEAVCEAVSSVLCQDYEPLEVVVVDDGSKDNTEEAIRRIDDTRIRYIRQPNSGACVARNNGILAANGFYVALLDSDDVFLPGHLRDAVRELRNLPELAVVYGRIRVDRGNGVIFEKPPRAVRPNEEVSEYLLCDSGFIQTSTVVLRKTLAQSVLFTPGLPFGQDTDFAIRLAYAGATFHMLPQPQAIWRDMPDDRRVSSRLDASAREKWLRSLNHAITPRAMRGDRGWVVAKCHASNGRWLVAFWLFLRSVIGGCYTPRLASRIFLQIFLTRRQYRRLADWTLSVRRQPSEG